MVEQFVFTCPDCITVKVKKMFKRIFKIRTCCSPRLQRFLEELDSMELGDDSHEYLKIVVEKYRFEGEETRGKK